MQKLSDKRDDIISKYNYYLALQKAKTVEECQAAYDHQVASKLRHYRAQDSTSYRELTAAHDPDYWILAENRAQKLKRHSHSYGNLIKRKLS